MSTINKKPFIQVVIESLDKTALTGLQAALNTTNNYNELRSLINDSYPITDDDKGVSKIALEVEGKVYTGEFIYNDTVCVLISYERDTAQKLKLVIINPTDKTYKIVEEPLTINELRRIVEVKLIEIEQSGDTNLYAKVHHYDEGDELTAEILNSIKDGDIICVNQMSFLIKKTNLTTHYLIHSALVFTANGGATLVQLDWDSRTGENTLTLTSINLAVDSGNEQTQGGSGEDTTVST